MAEFCMIHEDGTISNAPNPLRIMIANPSDERYRYEGYLEKCPTDPPEYDPETEYVVSHWEEDEGKAVQVWEVKERPEEPPTLEDRMNNLEQNVEDLVNGETDDNA